MSTTIQHSMTPFAETSPEVVWKRKFEVSKPHLLLLITEDWYFRSHRLDLARAARDAGMRVSIATLAQDNGKWIEDEGFRYLPIPFAKGGRHPLGELAAVIKLTRLYQTEQPDIVHHVALKPILYGSWAARLAKVPAVVNAFGGLGYVFIADSWRSYPLRMGIKAGLRYALGLPNSRVICQTSENCERLIMEKVVKPHQTVIIRGVGVDLSTFRPRPENTGSPIIVLACRMLWDKGIGDFVQAARILKQQKMAARCVLVGRHDPGSPTSVSENQLRAWHHEGVIEWWGHCDDMPNVLAAAHVVVLPTFYGEGIPKILLEASACARPVVTTSIPGCKEVVRDGENGFLISQKDPKALAEALTVLLKNPDLRRRMGSRGREIAVREFSAGEMARQTLAVYEELLENSLKRSTPKSSTVRPVRVTPSC